ncbi:hypothetical protein OIV83_002221 [Microbotryomycetes sp. JL201]|nr:hypothetical protein OIV83_002221 [Microbotryomycetes sp. JL201]
MKDTPSGVDEAVRQAQRSAQRRKARHGRGHRSDESITPPRKPPSYAREPAADTDWGFDESSVPPDQARKRDKDEDEVKASFNDSLLHAHLEDEGVGFYEDLMYSTQQQQQKYATSFSYGSAAGRAMGLGSAGADPLTAMDDEEYAEYMRAGMWRIKNKDEIERQEAIERERQRKLEKDRIEDERRRKKEQERMRRLEEKAKRKTQEQDKHYRQRYQDQWRKLVPATAAATTTKPTPLAPPPTTQQAPADSSSSSSSPAYPLRYTDFAWPVFPPMPLPPLSWPTVDDITSSAVARFLLEPYEGDKDKRKQVLRQAVLMYHPDRFSRLVERVPEDKQDVRDRVTELGLRVSQVLNDLMRGR